MVDVSWKNGVEKMNILVTCVAGFIGSHITRWLGSEIGGMDYNYQQVYAWL